MCLLTALSEDSVCIGVARVGTDAQCLKTSTLSEMTTTDLGQPLHSLVLVGQLHSLEKDMLRQFTSISSRAVSVLFPQDTT